jgi:hypothetical protein
MIKVLNILRKGLATTGNGFKIELSNLVKESGLSEIETIMALNSITQFSNAWDLITNY